MSIRPGFQSFFVWYDEGKESLIRHPLFTQTLIPPPSNLSSLTCNCLRGTANYFFVVITLALLLCSNRRRETFLRFYLGLRLLRHEKSGFLLCGFLRWRCYLWLCSIRHFNIVHIVITVRWFISRWNWRCFLVLARLMCNH